MEGDPLVAAVIKPILETVKDPECEKEKGNPGRNFCVHY